MGYYLDQWCLPHRQTWLDFIDQPARNILLLGPRGHLKTSSVRGFLLKEQAKNPDVAIAAVSITLDLSLANVKSMKEEWETNAKLKRDFGDLRGEPWGNEAYQLKRSRILKEPTVKAGAVGSSLIGFHFDIIWMDDIVDTQKNQWTPEMREKVWEWYQTTMKYCTKPNTKTIITGTRKHVEDFYSRILTFSHWQRRVDKAILDEDTHHVLCPFLYSYEKLVELRQEDPLRFAQEMQNEPVQLEGLTFKRDWLRYYDPSKPLPRFVGYYVGIDPAVGKTDVADYTAIVLLGMTSYQQYYVLDIQRQRWPINWVDKVIGIYKYYCDILKQRPNVVGVEAIYTGMMQARELQAAATAMPLKFVDYRIRTEDEGMKGQLPRDKIARLQSLGRYFEMGRVYLPDPNQNRMTVDFEKDEYLPFPQGAHDDMLDALNIAILVSPYSTQGRTFLYG